MSYKRLNDREARNKQDLGRKQVYLYTDAEKMFVELRFSQSYAPLFEKTLKAFEQVPSRFIGELFDVNAKDFILQAEFLGATLPSRQDELPAVTRFLRELYESKPRRDTFVVPRYLVSLRNAHPTLQVGKLVDFIKSTKKVYAVGFGIDDPVMSNFTEDARGIHMVDLDHFSTGVSLYYQIGFVMADVDILSGALLSITVNELQKRADAPQDEQLPLLTGYVSRLGIDVVNKELGLASFRDEESLECVMKLIDSYFNTRK